MMEGIFNKKVIQIILTMKNILKLIKMIKITSITPRKNSKKLLESLIL